MRILSKIIKYGAWICMLITVAIILFLFGYVFMKGYHVINWEFITASPSGAVLGEEGGIFPAICGSVAFTLTAVLIGGLLAVATAIYIVFYVKSKRWGKFLRNIIQCISGIPSIVLGLFSYSFFVRDLNFGRCILSSGIALAIMILPFIEVRVEKAFREFDINILESSYSLGCSKPYTILKIILPSTTGEIFSGIILGGCFAMGAAAPLIFTGAVAYAQVPTSVMQPAMALPLHLYLLVQQGASSIDRAYGTAFIMMVIILISNLLVTIYSRRRSRKWE